MRKFFPLIIIYLLFGSNSYLLAQSNSNWFFYNRLFKLDYQNLGNADLNQLEKKNNLNFLAAASISDKIGDLLLIGKNGSIYNNEYNILHANKMKGQSLSSFGRGEFFIQLNSNKFIFIYPWINTQTNLGETRFEFKLNYHIIEKINNDLVNDQFEVSSENIIFTKDTIIASSSFSNYLPNTVVRPIRRDSNEFLFFFIFDRYLYSLKIKDTKIQITDSIELSYNDFYPMKNELVVRNQLFTQFMTNNNGNKILLLKHAKGKLIIPNVPLHLSPDIESKNLNIIDFNLETWNFLDKRIVINIKENEPLSKIRPELYEMSENDSFLYSIKRGNQISNTTLERLNIHTNLFDFQEVFTFEDLGGLTSIKETPSGEIAIFQTLSLNAAESILKIYSIQNPNSKESFEVSQIGDLLLKPSVNTNSLSGLTPHLKDHIRLRYKVDYDCGATVKFENFSNPYRKFDTFTWWITNEEGNIDTIVTHEPELRYTKNGSYFYKVYGRSNQGYGYGEMWYDSIRINIPAKPVADFSVKDTIVCAHSPAFFTPLCTTDTIHPTREEEWHWDFGDGNQSVIYRSNYSNQVRHTYTEPGTYTVTLRYYNGFCDSVLTQENIIQIVEAPKPGFEVSAVQGCAPLSVEFIDTVTLYVQRKEYYFQDIDSWREIHLSQTTFNYTFDNPGWHWVVQQLVGYTGCVTRTDSVQIMVSKGFTASDTSHIFVATWQDVLPKQENWVSIQWNCLDETAHSYELKRNNQTMATFTECNGIGSYDDMEANANPNLRYRIVAADSCGRSTQVGRIGQPIFLQGAIKGQNEWAVIKFSPYADIQHQSGEFAYDIQTFSEGNWKTIHQPNAAGLFEDKPLISNDVNALEKCYRIVGQNQVQISISNVLCLPYLPSVILPSAFSPNGDALNEIYRPLTLGIVSYQMEIYNRWGQLIYSGDESQIGWDGNNAPQGVYVVKIQGIDNQHYFHSYVGSVTLVR